MGWGFQGLSVFSSGFKCSHLKKPGYQNQTIINLGTGPCTALHSIEPSPSRPAKPPSATTWHAAQSLHQPSQARQPLQPNQPRLLESVSLGLAQTSFPNFHPAVLIPSSRAIHSMKNTTYLRSAPFLLPVKQSQDLPCFPGDLVFSDHLTYPGLASLDLL